MDFSTIITYLKGFIPTILTFLMMLSPMTSAGVAYTAENPEELVVSFAVVSDIHVETNNAKSYNAYKELLEGMKAGEDISATVFLGDNVMNGQVLENLLFYTPLKAINPAEHNIVLMGNHDIGNGEGNYADLLENYLANNHVLTGERQEKPYSYKVINGCYFITLGIEDLTVNTSIMSQAQLDWLKGVLDEAAAADAPIFVLNHHPMTYLEGVDSNSLANLLGQYDKVMYLHGHIHKELTESSFYEVNGIPAINLTRATEITDYEAGKGLVIEVYEDEILVRGRDFIAGEWVEGIEYRYPL